MYRTIIRRRLENQSYAIVYYDEKSRWTLTKEQREHNSAEDFNITLKSLVDSLSIKKWSRKIQKSEMPRNVACPIIDSHMSGFAPPPSTDTKSSSYNIHRPLPLAPTPVEMTPPLPSIDQTPLLDLFYETLK